MEEMEHLSILYSAPTLTATVDLMRVRYWNFLILILKMVILILCLVCLQQEDCLSYHLYKDDDNFSNITSEKYNENDLSCLVKIDKELATATILCGTLQNRLDGTDDKTHFGAPPERWGGGARSVPGSRTSGN